MSINVTVKGNPISIRRGKMVLSDFENIRKTEKEHRKRLRKEQVNEQAKALAKKVLERARRVEKEQLSQLEKDGNTEMKRAQEKRLLEIQHRFQDIENIGYAHANAARKPDVESIKRAEEQRNKVAARTRGTEAIHKLQEANKAVSSQSKPHERLRKVRELENERSSMVAHLPKKSCIANDFLESSDNENIVKSTSTSRKKVKGVVSKKSPLKKVSKNIKVPNTKLASQISVSVNNEDDSRTIITTSTSTSTTTTTTSSSMATCKTSCPNKSTNIPKIVSDLTPEVSKANICESDENEPRKTVPVTSTSCGKPEKLIKSKTKNYQDSSSDLSSTSTVSSSSVSDDSSYFSDINSKTPIYRKTPRHHTSPVSSKVDLYDYKTRQRNVYDRPSGLVERMNVKNKPSAEELAQEMIESENKESELLLIQKQKCKQRSNDAVLREKVRRGYENMLKNIDLLTKQERLLKSKQLSKADNKQVPPPCKIREDRTKKQKKMDRALQNILRTSKEPAAPVDCIERSITITPRDYIHSKTTPSSEWKEPPHIDGQESEENYTDDDDYTHKRTISELLIKLEKLKRRLLQEYGTDLPDAVFNASVKSLFNNRSLSSASQERVECSESKPVTPELQVINMSDETVKPLRKFIAKSKPITKTPARYLLKPKCTTTSTMTTCDQQVQVAMESDEKKQEGAVCHPLEPIVKIINPRNADNSSSFSSNSSVATDLLINVSKKEITVVPKDKENHVTITKEVSASSVKSTLCTNNKTPVKISFEQKNGCESFEVAGVLINTNKREITVLPKRKSKKTSETVSKKNLSAMDSQKSISLPTSRTSSPVKKLSKSAPPSRQLSPKKIKSQTRLTKSLVKKVEKPQKSPCKKTQKSPCKKPQKSPYQKPQVQEQKFKTQYTQVSINSSTESSQLNSTSDNGNSSQIYTSYQTMASKHIFSQIQDASDASTTYMNPPPAVAGIFLDSNGSAILELLDPSGNEELKQKALLISPILSPETPSPNTMKLTSNVSKSDQMYRRLKFTSLLSARQIKTDSSSQSKTAHTSTCATTATTTTREASASVRTASPRSSTQTQSCTCKNPACKLFHEEVEDTQAYALKHCPEILKKYEHLQNVCSERIASLTDLIEKVRNEQRGLELSVVANGDSTSTSQINSQTRSSATAESSSLVRNIEAIHAQLKRTLMESQQIISGEGIAFLRPLKAHEKTEKCPSSRFDLSKETSTSESFEEDADKPKCIDQATPTTVNKPKVLTNERVSLRLDRFRLAQSARKSGGSDAPTATTTTARMEMAPSTSSDQNEKMVEMLSKEILEQSKNINKSVPNDKLKSSDDSLLKSSQALVKENSEESSKTALSNDEINQSSNLETYISDFIPLLAGIPKIPRKSSSSNGRTRPPVTLISGPYRPEIAVSPAHELSTIVELDTPDTVNKSQVSTRSPSNKAKKKLLIGAGTQSTTKSPSKKADMKLNKSKPSVHVAPLPAHRPSQFSFNSSNKSVTRSAEKSPRKSIEKISEPFEKKKIETCESKQSLSSESMHTLPDMHIEQLQQSQDNADANSEFRISEISEMCSLPDENIEQILISEICEESKSKSATPEQRPNQEQEEDKGQLTSTSSTSFSGLSGVSEITTTPSSDLNLFKCPSSPEELESALKKWGLGWAIPTLKKTREASALGSSSSSDGTPVNAARLVSPVKKHQEGTNHDLPEISDVSSISIKHANKSTERSVLVKGRTSTPNRLSNSNSDGTISTLGSFSSDLNIVVQDQSADMTIPNISFSNNKLA